MNWRAANSLITLRNQLNALYPGRSKASDGTIGDAAHQAGPSDHNPNREGVVTALDITHDPAHGLSIQVLADRLVANKDQRIKYIICNRRIWEPSIGWTTYDGDNPHQNHLHLSVLWPLGDNSQEWKLSQEKGEYMELNRGDAINLYRDLHRKEPTEREIAAYLDWSKNNKDQLLYNTILLKVRGLYDYIADLEKRNTQLAKNQSPEIATKLEQIRKILM